ncbi:MAG: hypothetical protein ACRC4W_03890 [Treponemataceae bacterium]
MKNNIFNYELTFSEIKELLLFLRQCDPQIPHSLDNFVGKLENDIYNSLTIEEAEQFLV